MYEESMNTVLVQEVKRFNRLLNVMIKTLFEVQRALKGLAVMSGELENLANSIYDQKVPDVWVNVAYPSLKPLLAWCTDLVQRLNFLQEWIDTGTPKAFWISGFFFPQAFVTGSRQNYARKMRLAIDTISFDYLAKDTFDPDGSDIQQGPTDGCYIYGLFLEAARWDKTKHQLADPLPKELYSAMPVIHLQPVKDRPITMTGVYHVPVYKELRRAGMLSTTGHSTNFVMWIELPSGTDSIFRKSLVSETNMQVNFADSDKWCRAGVAAFCALRY
jgi:dynein heavy chain